jgi:polysaccharide export outer membrane protein
MTLLGQARNVLLALGLSAFGLLVTACAEEQQQATPAPVSETYTLGTGDQLRVIVFGETDLSGQFTVDDGGHVRLPLIGQVDAAGRTLHQFEGDVAAKLSQGYLKNPRVSVEVTNYRPFFIIGEVNKPGEYPYVNGMNVLNAVALAGGFTYRAREGEVYIKHVGSNEEEEVDVEAGGKVQPGDIIRVKERFF